jgi:hypothetical protein
MRKPLQPLVLLTLTALMAACGQQIPTAVVNKPILLGATELTLDTRISSELMPQAALPDNSISNMQRVFTSSVDDATGTRWIFSTFTFKNASASTFYNMTFYAYHKGSSGIGGTALNSLARSDLTSISDPNIARLIRPTHGMRVDGLTNTVNANTADFQAFRESEIAAFQSEALAAGVITSNDSVLQYGYTARDVVDNSRTILPGGTGRITIAVRYKTNPDPTINPTRFNMTFVLANESVRRVTRSIEETSAQVQSRKTSVGASEVVEIGTGAATSIVIPDVTTSIEGQTLRGIGTPFPTNSLVAARVGTDTNPNGQARAYFLDVLDGTSGLVLKTLAVRSTSNGSQAVLTGSGMNSHEGILTRSQNGKCLVLTGYNAPIDTFAVNNSSFTRGVAVVYGDGAISTATKISDGFQNGTVGGASSDNCTRFWVAGNGGIRLANLKSTGFSIPIVTGPEVYRSIRLQDFFAYVTVSNSTTQRVSSLTGIPTSGLDTPTPFPGITMNNNIYDLALFDLSGDVSGVDTMYVANASDGVQKFSLVAGTWILNGSSQGCGVVGSFLVKNSAGVRTIYVTKDNSIQKLTDSTDYNQSWTDTCSNFATSAGGIYTGISFAPAL